MDTIPKSYTSWIHLAVVVSTQIHSRRLFFGLRTGWRTAFCKKLWASENMASSVEYRTPYSQKSVISQHLTRFSRQHAWRWVNKQEWGRRMKEKLPKSNRSNRVSVLSLEQVFRGWRESYCVEECCTGESEKPHQQRSYSLPTPAGGEASRRLPPAGLSFF